MEQSAELAVLQYIWFWGNTREETADLLSLQDRFFIKHRDFFLSTQAFFKGDYKGDKTTPEQLRMIEAWNNDPRGSFTSISYLISELKKEYIMTSIKDTKLNDLSSLENLVANIYSIKEDEDKTIKQLTQDVYDTIVSGKTRGVDCGIPWLDGLTVGLKRGHVWTIGGYTNTGKTSVALDIVREVAKTQPVVFYSLEMTSHDLTERLVRREQKEVGDLGKAIDQVRSLDLRIYHSKVRLHDIETHLISLKNKPFLVVIDFLQNVETEDKSEYERMTRIPRTFQNIALNQNVCMLELSQIDNESANNSKKTLGFKGSGAIAACCDVGIEIERDKDEDGDIVDIVFKLRKNRHGRKGMHKFEFDTKNNVIIFDKSKKLPGMWKGDYPATTK